MDKMKVRTFQRGGVRGNGDTFDVAARFYARHLMSPRLANKLSLRIELRASHPCIKKGAWGAAYHGCREVAGGRREYTIVIDRDLPEPCQLRTLAHEIAHIEQYMRGKLKYRYLKTQNQPRKTWLGVDHTDTPYAQRPWEIEANEQEARLYKLWEERRISRLRGTSVVMEGF